MRILIGCELSGTVRQAFRTRGHDAWSCDTRPAEDGSPHHIVGDVRDHLADGWDLGIFHPPCTYLCSAGVRWLEERDLWREMEEGIELFLACLNAPIPRVAVENPRMHGHALKRIGRPQMILHPWQFGHPVQKETWIWTRNLPPLAPTRVVEGRATTILDAPDMAGRSDFRSLTFTGIANAMARQWDCPAARMAKWKHFLSTGEGWAEERNRLCDEIRGRHAADMWP